MAWSESISRWHRGDGFAQLDGDAFGNPVPVAGDRHSLQRPADPAHGADHTGFCRRRTHALPVASGATGASLLAWATAYAIQAQVLSTYSALALFALGGAVLLVSLVGAAPADSTSSRKKSGRPQEALLAGQERTRLILENALDAVISIDAAGHITGINPGAEELFGWRETELIGRTLASTIVPPRYRHAHTMGLRRHIETGEQRILSQRIEVSALRRDGSEFPVEVSITRIEGSSGVEFSAFIRDITERKAAENRLRTQLDRLTLLDRITRAVNERNDLSSVYATVLVSLEQHLGVDFAAFLAYEASGLELRRRGAGDRSRTQAERIGLARGTRIPVKDGLARSLQGEMAHERDLAHTTVPFARRLGQSGLGALVIAPVLHQDRLTGAFLAARRPGAPLTSADCEFPPATLDNVALAAHQAKLVNNLQVAYENLRRTEQALVQQERLRAYGQLASGVAHDINNSLSPASLALGLVLEAESTLSADGRRHVELALQSIESASQTIARMREFYRRRDESPSEHRPVDLNKTIDSALALTRARWNDLPQQRGTVIELARELGADLPKIEAVESEVQDALTNLILNAADAMPDGGVLTLRSKRVEDRIVAEIEDSGTGMDERTRQHCIEPFFTTQGRSWHRPRSGNRRTEWPRDTARNCRSTAPPASAHACVSNFRSRASRRHRCRRRLLQRRADSARSCWSTMTRLC